MQPDSPSGPPMKGPYDPDAIRERVERAARQPTLPRESDPVEALADIEHQQWAAWAQSLLDDESTVLSEARRERWERLIATPYADLAEAEKEQDREWARKVAAIRSRPVEEGERHPDDGHAHSFGCRLCGVDAPARPVEVDPERLRAKVEAVKNDTDALSFVSWLRAALSSPEPRKP